jgi:hypothetical protein
MDLEDIAGLGTTEVQNTFKRVYLKAVNAIPDSTPLTAQMQRTTKFKAGTEGLYFNVKLRTGAKVANVADGILLPTPSRPTRKTGKANLAHTYTVIAVGGQSVQLTRDNRNAFVSNLKDQMEDGMDRVRYDLERQYNGDGRGILCVIDTVSGAPTYGCISPYGVTGAGPGTMLLLEGMEVAAINPANGAERDRQTIEEVDWDNEEFTTGAAITNAEIGDYLVLCNNVDATGTDAVNNYGAEASGILSAVATGDVFEDIDGGDYRRWNATVMTSTGPQTEKKAAILDARIKAASGKKPNLYYTTRGIIIEMQDQLAGLRRFSGETKTLRAGYEGLDLNGRTVLAGDWCPKGNFFALCTESSEVGMIDLVPMGYVDLDGAELHRVEGRHAYRADLWMPHNLIWFGRNSHGRQTGLDDDTSIVR